MPLTRDLRQRFEVCRDVPPKHTIPKRPIRIEKQLKTTADDEPDVAAFDLAVLVQSTRMPSPMSESEYAMVISAT